MSTSPSQTSAVDGYTRSVLSPQLRSLRLSKKQRAIVIADVSIRLRSVLAHWHEASFRRTILLLGLEEASFWEPLSANIEIRSLVAVAIRNSLIEDLHASHAYINALRSETRLLPDEGVPWITGPAIEYFAAARFQGEGASPENDTFGSLPMRFPRAWHVLSILGSLSELETTCELPVTHVKPAQIPIPDKTFEEHSVILSGIDPNLDGVLLKRLHQIEQGEADPLFASSFRGISRNPEKLLSVIDHVLAHGATVLTPNYLLSPTHVARRDPLLRPEHRQAETKAKAQNPTGLTKRHRKELARIARQMK